MTALLIELKTRARLRLNAARATQPGLRLHDCLQEAAREVGFLHWEHGRRVLGALAVPGDDMGRFWHAPRCNGLLSEWFADLSQARAVLAADAGAVLLPYRRQFVVARSDFIRELGLDPHDTAWRDVQRDLVRSYGTGPWVALALKRIKAPRETFA